MKSFKEWLEENHPDFNESDLNEINFKKWALPAALPAALIAGNLFSTGNVAKSVPIKDNVPVQLTKGIFNKLVFIEKDGDFVTITLDFNSNNQMVKDNIERAFNDNYRVAAENKLGVNLEKIRKTNWNDNGKISVVYKVINISNKAKKDVVDNMNSGEGQIKNTSATSRDASKYLDD
jgi:hypothetical protein